MITLSRLSGSVFVLNSDLIERIDAAPDTIISLVDGTKYVVAESMTAVVDAIRVHRAELIALSNRLGELPAVPGSEPRRLAAVATHQGADERADGDT